VVHGALPPARHIGGAALVWNDSTQTMQKLYSNANLRRLNGRPGAFAAALQARLR
jgi:hypothetical protein